MPGDRLMRIRSAEFEAMAERVLRLTDRQPCTDRGDAHARAAPSPQLQAINNHRKPGAPP
ncbi:hypothetical protein ABT168_04720 [Streptomyces sp. NPDC001793]|uniref:hypothetical protein n=1 Tax=Streptomyces sp. NPDC001793 TaxID=3154657 RepID=UPI003331D7CA